MKDQDKTKEQVMNELAEMRQRVAELEASETERLSAEQAGNRAEEAIPGRRIWLPVAGMFVLLCFLVWLDEFMALPSLLLGGPHTPINWREAIIEMVLIASVGGYVVLRLIPDITEHKRAEEALELKVKQLAALSQASQAVTASLELDQVLAEIVSLASEVVASDYAGVVLVDEAGHLGRSAENLPGVPGIEYRIRDKGLTRWIVRSRQAGVIDEIGEDGGMIPDLGEGAPRFANPPIVEAGVKSVAGLPLMVKDRLLGVLYLHSLHAGAFHGQLPLLTTFANQVAIAVENAWLYEGAQQEITERKRAEEELIRLSNAVKMSTDSIVIGDLEAKIIDVNEATLRMYGTDDKGDLVGKNSFDLFAPEDREKAFAGMEETLERGYIEGREYHIIIKDGSRIPVEMSAALMKDADGKPIGFVSVSRDITKRKRAEEELGASEQRYRLLFERNLAGVYRSTLDGRILDCNESYARIFGYDSQEEVLALRASELYFDAADRETFIARLREQGTLTNSEWCLRRKDDSPVWVLENASLIEEEEDEPTVVQGTLVDITKRKRAERLLLALNLAALAMGKAMRPEEIFTTVAEELKKLGFACTVLLTDESQKRLFPKYFSYGAKAIKAAEKLVGLKAEDLSIPVEAVDVYGKVIRERKTVFVENAEEVMRQLLPGPAKRLAGQIARMLKVSKSIDAALIAEDEVIGLFLVQSDDLTEGDIPAITAFAHQMAAAWRKARLMQDLEKSLTEQKRAEEGLRQSYVKLERTLHGTVNCLASAIERRDPYTAGHQRRVTQLACAIAEEMGLPEEQIDGLRVAGLIHDIGKINVPAEILSKPGSLTELEFGLIKMHSQVGHDILKEIEFPWPVAQIVLQHHERMDGSGYPQGLLSQEIMLEARILAVADVVEAMASHRPYRPSRGIGLALGEISQNRDVLYDPEVVDACLKLFIEKGFKLE